MLPNAFDAEIHGEEPMVTVDEGEGQIAVSYTFPGFFISDDVRSIDGEELQFNQLNIAATGFLAKGGRPLLPSFGRYVQIPVNCDYAIDVEKGQPVKFDDVLVLPAQEMVTDSPDQEQVFQYDRDFYGADTVYPEDLVRVSGPFFIDDYTSLLVHVTPFQYNPAKRELTGFGSVTVTITVMPRAVADAAEEETPVGPEVNREAFGNLFLNPRRSIAENLDLPPTGEGTGHTRLRGKEFLIIYDDRLHRAATKLKTWKNQRGLRTEAYAMSGIGNSVGQIKTFIRDRRSGSARLRYVLLLGDVELIAPEIVTAGPWGDNCTDYYYSTPTDPSHPQDLVMPWLAIGRIPVRFAGEAMTVVNKIVAYEKRPPRDPDYYERMTFAAYFQDTDSWNPTVDGKACRAYMKTMESIRKQMQTYGFEVERVYVAQTPTVQYYLDGAPVPADVVASIVDSDTATEKLVAATTKGQLVIGHRDHGLEDGWHEPRFRKSDLDSISGKMPTVFFSINCLTGQFDLPTPSESFAEKILSMKGATPSLVAATRVSATWLNDHLMKALFDATWGGVLPTFPSSTASYPVRYNRLGDILNYAKAYLPIKVSGSPEYVKDHFEIYHVVGDPTLEIWRAKPRRFMLKAWLEEHYLHIKLYRIPQDCVLTIFAGDELLRRLEPSSTYLKLSLPWHVMRKELSVWFWAPGYRYRRVRVRAAM
jgi:hypothetical protein